MCTYCTVLRQYRQTFNKPIRKLICPPCRRPTSATHVSVILYKVGRVPIRYYITMALCVLYITHITTIWYLQQYKYNTHIIQSSRYNIYIYIYKYESEIRIIYIYTYKTHTHTTRTVCDSSCSAQIVRFLYKRITTNNPEAFTRPVSDAVAPWQPPVIYNKNMYHTRVYYATRVVHVSRFSRAYYHIIHLLLITITVDFSMHTHRPKRSVGESHQTAVLVPTYHI